MFHIYFLRIRSWHPFSTASWWRVPGASKFVWRWRREVFGQPLAFPLSLNSINIDLTWYAHKLYLKCYSKYHVRVHDALSFVLLLSSVCWLHFTCQPWRPGNKKACVASVLLKQRGEETATSVCVNCFTEVRLRFNTEQITKVHMLLCLKYPMYIFIHFFWIDRVVFGEVICANFKKPI